MASQSAIQPHRLDAVRHLQQHDLTDLTPSSMRRCIAQAPRTPAAATACIRPTVLRICCNQFVALRHKPPVSSARPRLGLIAGISIEFSKRSSQRFSFLSHTTCPSLGYQLAAPPKRRGSRQYPSNSAGLQQVAVAAYANIPLRRVISDAAKLRAIDSRYKPRPERLQGPRVIPVKQVPMLARQAHRRYPGCACSAERTPEPLCNQTRTPPAWY